MRLSSMRVAPLAAKKLSAAFKATNAYRHPRLEALEERLAFAVHEWTGLGADNLWSNPQNWTNGSPSSDVSGDVDLVFHTNLVNAANLVTQNDLVTLAVDSITFDANPGVIGPTTFANGGTSNAGYTINGNAIIINVTGAGQASFGIDIANNVTNAAGITETVNADINLVGLADTTFRSQQNGARLTMTGDIDLGTQTLTMDNAGTFNADQQSVVISGDISNGNLLKNNLGTLELSGDNSYQNTTVNGGVLLATSDTALGNFVGQVTVNDPGRIELRNGVTVSKGTPLVLNSNQLLGGLGADGNTTNTWNGPIALQAGAGGVALGAGNGAANAGTRLIIDGLISGATSTLSLNGAGVIQFTRNNTYTGITDINGNRGFSTLQIDAPAGLGAGGDANRTIIRNGGGGQPGGTLALNFNGTLQDGAAVAEEIDFAGSGVGALGAVRSVGNANVIIPGNITFIAAAPWVFAVDGALGSITTTGVIDSQGLNRALTKIGPGTLVIGGASPNVFTGNTVINGGVVSVTNTSANPLGVNANSVIVNSTGTLRVEAGATVPNVVQLNGGTLAGSGTVNNTVTSLGGTVSPGTSPGALTVNNNVTLDAASTFRAEINGTTAGVNFDQFIVNGAVTLGGAKLEGSVGFVPAIGDTFPVIVNDGVDAVVGTFAGLPEGAKVALGGSVLSISYVGGSGNDVVLTRVAGAAVGIDPTDPTKTALVVSGTDAADIIKIEAGPDSKIKVTLNAVVLGSFAFTGNIFVLGQGGGDTITVGSKLTRNTFIYGGAGSDKITTGNGKDVVVAGDGNDTASAGNGRDVLIGGDGADVLGGSDNDDILIAGTTAFDVFSSANVTKLATLRNEWASSLSYSARVSRLLGTTPGSPFVFVTSGGGQNVFDDGDIDQLTGGKGTDWFLGNFAGGGVLDTIVGKIASETATEV